MKHNSVPVITENSVGYEFMSLLSSFVCTFYDYTKIQSILMIFSICSALLRIKPVT